MPPKMHVKSKQWWRMKLPRGELQASRDVTWADAQACIAALNANSSEVFAGLHRCEGGFMCVEGPRFKSEDRVDRHRASGAVSVGASESHSPSASAWR